MEDDEKKLEPEEQQWQCQHRLVGGWCEKEQQGLGQWGICAQKWWSGEQHTKHARYSLLCGSGVRWWRAFIREM